MPSKDEFAPLCPAFWQRQQEPLLDIARRIVENWTRQAPSRYYFWLGSEAESLTFRPE